MERQIALCDLPCNPGFMPRNGWCRRRPRITRHQRASAFLTLHPGYEGLRRLLPAPRIHRYGQQGTVGQRLREVGLLSCFERGIRKLSHEALKPGRRPCLEGRFYAWGTTEMQKQALDDA